MLIKSALSSKTLWFNVITIVLGFLALPEFVAIIPVSFLIYLTFINAIGNMILRTFFTSQPITQIAADKPKS